MKCLVSTICSRTKDMVMAIKNHARKRNLGSKREFTKDALRRRSSELRRNHACARKAAAADDLILQSFIMFTSFQNNVHTKTA
jgi:hypothetical protein